MEEENIGQPLLKKQYYENCPGCKVDQAKELKRGVSFRNLLYIWLAVLCGTLPVASLFPFVYFMVKDFNIAKKEEDISAYAGYVGSAFMLGRSLTSILWGMIADRYGRKPVIIIGVITVVIFNTLFGLSTNLWMAVSMRFLLGSLNGLLGPIKAYATEIVREEHHALGLSTVVAAWGVGLVIGPALGGYLAQPAVKYPHLFPKDSFWDKFPYFLPCFIISAFAFAVAIACIWLPETLHNHNGRNESTDNAEALENGNSGADNDKMKKKDESIFLNWPLMSSIIVYCIFSLHDIAYQEVFSLWAVSPRRLGGLNFTTDDVGNVLAISALEVIALVVAMANLLMGEVEDEIFGIAKVEDRVEILENPLFVVIVKNLGILKRIRISPMLPVMMTTEELVNLPPIQASRSAPLSSSVATASRIGIAIIIYQLSLYPSMQKACGPVTLARISGALSIPLLQCYPFMTMLSSFTLYLVIIIASILKNLMSETIATTLFLLQNRAVEQHQRGAANGMTMTAMSAFKTIGPAGGGAILTWSQKRINAQFLPGTHLVFFVLNVVEGLGVLLMFKPFLSVKKKTPSE